MTSLEQTPQLRRSLGVLDGVAIAASSTAPTTSIGIGMGSLAATVGLQAPAILLVAFLPILGIATAYARLNRDEPNCGNGYVWVGRSLGPWAGFLTGWVTLVASVIFMAYTSAVTGSVVLQFLNKAHVTEFAGLDLNPDKTLLSTLVGLVVLSAVTVTAITGVRHATRLQSWLLGFEYSVLLGFFIWAVTTGDNSFSMGWLNPFAIDSATGLAQGFVLAVFFFWGWDSAFSVTEETNKAGDAARGGFIALFAMLGLFLFGAIAMQREMGLSELIENGPQGLTHLGEKIADEPLASLPLLALMFSAVASLQAGVIPAARGMLAMGRDRTMGSVWTKVHPKYGSPATGTALIMAVVTGVALFSVGIPKLSDMILAAVNSIGLIVALYYGLTATACAVRFRGDLKLGLKAALGSVIIPALSALVLFGAGIYLAYDYLTMSDSFELSPDNGWFMVSIPAVIIVSGFVMAAVAKYKRKSPYFTTGRGTDGDTLALSADDSLSR